MIDLSLTYWTGFCIGMFTGAALGICLYAMLYASGRER